MTPRHRTALLAPLLLLSGCTEATARTIAVSDTASLEKAVASARSGDQITLAPGTYGSLAIRKRVIEGAPVTLSGKGARIASIVVENSEGWAFDGLEFGGAVQQRNRVVLIQQSRRVAVRNSLITGIKVNNDPWDSSEVGIGLRNARDVDILGNRFRDLAMAFVTGSSANVRFEGNSIAFIREGSNWVATKTLTIRCNRFSHFYPNWLRKEHPDAMQGWWNQDGNNENVLIEGNVMMLGGPRAVQGIFFAGARLPTDDHEKGRLRNITIRDNIYYGSSLHGISLSGVENAVIERNTVLPSPHAQQPRPPARSEDGRRSSAIVPRIRVLWDESTGVVTGNIAAKYQLPPLMEKTGNITVPVQNDRGGKPWSKTLAAPVLGEDPDLAAFAPRTDAGARPVCGKLLPPPVDAPSDADIPAAD